MMKNNFTVKDVPSPIIEKMTADDVSAVAETERECFKENAWSEKSLFDETQNETAHFFVVKNDEEVYGYIGTNIIVDECYITNVAVKEKYRRFGFGQRLILHAAKNAEQNGCRLITLECRKSNLPAASLYKKCGFEVCGERKNFYSSPKEDAYIMTYYFKGTD